MKNTLNTDHHPWKISEAIKIYLLTQVSVALLYLFIGLAFNIDFGNPYFNLIFITISPIALLVSVLYVVKNKHKLTIKTSLNLFPLKSFDLWLYIIIGISMAIILEVSIPNFSTKHSFISKCITNKSTFAITAFGAILIAPLCEEIFWRGFVFPVLGKYFSKNITIFLVTILSAIEHFPGLWGVWGSLIAVLFASFIYTLLRYKTNSTLSCIITHTVYNATIIAIPIVKHIFK